ncbi:E3 ubiquitin-protein ligase TRIM39-like isoform X2 [Coturnix japonica]|uniref:E3 ubiquitin-protein ligase TRIM39-like isoform X2 n=1 Tax=Coturnix japonica TaxID=93934 RepID=UPI0013A5CAD2|nr:E3 ubiquitin-protein ligase TRIM39-like isoform X2 [Coturnix japonica]XP_032297012.1 E3 ubiquitin-protein ligase TRIM39-like isoform X2 [Coturnix japonica]
MMCNSITAVQYIYIVLYEKKPHISYISSFLYLSFEHEDPESQQNSLSVRERAQKYESQYLTNGSEISPQKESRVNSPKRPQESFSKQSKGNTDPVIVERDAKPLKQPQSVQDEKKRLPYEFSGRMMEMSTLKVMESVQEGMEKILNQKLAVFQRQMEKTQQGIPHMKEQNNTWSSLQKISDNIQALQKGLEDMKISTKKDLQKLREDLEERVAKAPEKSESKENLLEVGNLAGRTVEMSTSKVVESMQEGMEKILTEKLAAMQRQMEKTQQAIPPMKEQNNTWTSLQKISDNIQALQKGLEDMQRSTKKDLQMLREDLEERVAKAPERSESKESLLEMENQAGRTVEMITSKALESMREEIEKILNEKLAAMQRQLEVTQHTKPSMEEENNTWASHQKISEDVQALQTALERMQMSTEEDIQKLRADLKGSFIEQRYKVDVTLNADTAHPRLEVSEDGKSVNDTGVIRKVPNREERFDSHLFVLAKEGYTSGRYYWEVDVGRRKNWILGVASESVTRKGTVTLSPKKGFWVIALADGQEYWAYTDPWTRLTVSGRPQKIGIFLNISANKLAFYNAKKKTVLYTFNMGGSVQKRKFVPFFSTGSGASVHDTEPLKIMQEFDDDD